MSLPAEIDHAAAILRDGGLVAFPTETVYGLGADARNPDALRRIYAAKGRPPDHPLIVHIGSPHELASWARDIPAAARTLAERYWPGPLTLVLRRAAAVDDIVTGGQDTVAVRMPSHPVARALLAAFTGGIAAPSANRYGRISATSADHVREEFGGEIDCVLDGGASEVGIESTIVDVSGTQPAVLRPGHITAAEIARALGVDAASLHAMADSARPRVPGSAAVHYAPRTPLVLADAAHIARRVATVLAQERRIAVLAHEMARPTLAQGLAWISAPPDAAGYARELYANLRRLDAAHCSLLMVEKPPRQAAWAAVNDRLARAAGGATA